MKDQIIKFWRDEEGATAIEYGLIAGLIAVGLIFSLEGVRTAISGLFDKIANLLNGVSPSSGAPKSI
jgi:pilus assembly protein Flp/PilA